MPEGTPFFSGEPILTVRAPLLDGVYGHPVPLEGGAVVTADEADNRILECAVTAKAHLIVTGDNHLRTLGRFRSITIASPREFLDARLWEAE